MHDAADALTPDAMLDQVEALVPAWFAAADGLDRDARPPLRELQQLSTAGALGADLAYASDAPRLLRLLRLLRLIGRGNMSLGRIVEGHVNAMKLVALYGRPEQVARAARDAAEGHLFAIWATETSDPVRLVGATPMILHGRKVFGSAAHQVTRALVTADRDGVQQLVLAPLRAGARVGPEVFDTHGMRGCDTGCIDLSGLTVEGDALIGGPGDYLRQPEFSAGAWRASAVALGGLDALIGEVRGQLRARGRADDPHQQARLGQMLIAQETAALWVAKAARIAEAGDGEAGEVAAYVNLARIAVESVCLDAMRLAQRSLGLAAFVRPNPVERLLRDLATYLRQPAPDVTLTEAADWFTAHELPA